jgi:hypothetical protein
MSFTSPARRNVAASPGISKHQMGKSLCSSRLVGSLGAVIIVTVAVANIGTIGLANLHKMIKLKTFTAIGLFFMLLTGLKGEGLWEDAFAVLEAEDVTYSSSDPVRLQIWYYHPSGINRESGGNSDLWVTSEAGFHSGLVLESGCPCGAWVIPRLMNWRLPKVAGVPSTMVSMP